MMDLKQRCEYIKGLLRILKRYKERTNLGYSLIVVVCPVCQIKTNINGVTAHSKRHYLIILQKKQAILLFVYKDNTVSNCVVCDLKLLHFDSKGSFNLRNIITCSRNCALKLKWLNYAILNRYKICPVCNTEHTSYYKCCSIECGRVLTAILTSNWHKTNKGTKSYRAMCKTISLKLKVTKDGIYYPAWNKGLVGKAYTDHFNKEDGSNSLYDSIARNSSFFKKTKPELIFLEIIISLEIPYKYNLFINNRQFDFLLCLLEERIIVLIDGDWWHKSSIKCSDQTERKIHRLKDVLKLNLLKEVKPQWQLIRIWENDLYNDYENISLFIKNLKENILGNNIDQYRNNLSEIKEYYLKKG